MGCEADFTNFLTLFPFSAPFDPSFAPPLPSFPRGSVFETFDDGLAFFADVSPGLACCFMEGARWDVFLNVGCFGGGALDWVRRGEGDTERSRG